MKKYGLYYDIDSFGHNTNTSVVIDVNAFIFDKEKMISDNPYTCRDYQNVKRFKLSIKDQKQNYGYEIEKETAEFWQTQDQEIRKRILPKDDDLTVTQFVNQFILYINSEPQIDKEWCNDKSIHPLILERLFSSQNKIKNDYLNRYNIIDMPSYLYAVNDSVDRNFCPIEDTEFWNKIYNKNNGTWDVMANVLRIQCVLRAENDKENIIR